MEGEVFRYALQGVEVSFRIMQGMAQASIRLSAFLKALSRQYQTETGEISLKKLMKKGETLNIGNVPHEKTYEFSKLAKEYGLLYCAVEKIKDGETDIMFRSSDLPKFNAIFERLRIVKNDTKVDEYKVEDRRESVIDRMERLERQQKKEQEVVPAVHRVSDMPTGEISRHVKFVNMNNPPSFTPEGWQVWLEAQALMWNYSESNRKIIARDKPDASLVLSESNWKKLGRAPDHSKAINIRAPEIKDGKHTGVFVDAKVYDVSDTEGAPVKLGDQFTRISDKELAGITDSIAGQHKVIVRDDLKQDAVFDAGSNTIFLKAGLNKDSRFKALQRESIYAKCFAEQVADYSRDANRLRAESGTYAITAKYGIDASEYKFDYMYDLMRTDPKSVFPIKDLIKADISRSTQAMNLVKESLRKIVDINIHRGGER